MSVDPVGSALGVIGIVVGWILYRRGLRLPRLVLQHLTLWLVGRPNPAAVGHPSKPALPGDVTVLYKGVEVPRLVKTTVVIWNAGSATLRGSDVVASDPLRLEFNPDARILEVTIAKVSRSVIDFQTTHSTTEPNVLRLTFDFLDPQDGARFEILHTDVPAKPKISGTTRGLPKGCLDWGAMDLTPERPRARRRIAPAFAALWPAYMLYDVFAHPEKGPPWWPYLLTALTLLMLILLIPWRPYLRRFPRALREKDTT